MAGATATDHPEDRSEEGSTGLPEAGDAIDTATFEQILEMDDDEDEREFSKSIVFDFFQQAESTFDKMESNLEKKDLGQLSQLGHFLKGSSATLGLTKVKDSCEKIQHFGANKDETGTHDEPDDEVCLERLTKIIAQAKQEFKDVEKVLRKFYHDEAAPDPAPAETTTTAAPATTTPATTTKSTSTNTEKV